VDQIEKVGGRLKLLAFVTALATLALGQPSPPAKKLAQNVDRGTALPNAKTILERSLEATGGIESQKSIKTQKLLGRMVMPAVGISGTMVMYRSQQGEMYQVIEIPGAGKTEVGNNGDVEWERSTLTGPKVRRVASTPGGLLQPDPASLAIVDRFSKIETTGMDRVNGKPCYTVHQWPSGGGPMQSACFDRETFLLVQLETNAGATPLKITLADYRSVGPVKLPFLIETETRGQTVRIEVETIALNDPLPPQASELPEEIEKLAYRPPQVEIRDLEVDKVRPILRHRTKR
jgi:hypothetical protein